MLIDTARAHRTRLHRFGRRRRSFRHHPTEIMVNGKTPGETSLIIWDTRGGRQFFNVKVRAGAACFH